MIEDTEQAYSVTFSLKRNLAGSLQEPDDYIVNISGRIYGYRKRGLGLAVACSFIDTFGKTYGLAVGLPYPLQFDTTRKANGMERCNLKTSPTTKGWPRKNFKLIGSNSE